jgi:hypothetical protein
MQILADLRSFNAFLHCSFLNALGSSKILPSKKSLPLFCSSISSQFLRNRSTMKQLPMKRQRFRTDAHDMSPSANKLVAAFASIK